MGTKRQIIDDIITVREWAELVEKGGCTALVLDQALQMIGRLHNAERLLDSLLWAERDACAGIVKKEIKRWDRESVVELRESIIHEIEIRARAESEKKGE